MNVILKYVCTILKIVHNITSSSVYQYCVSAEKRFICTFVLTYGNICIRAADWPIGLVCYDTPNSKRIRMIVIDAVKFQARIGKKYSFMKWHLCKCVVIVFFLTFIEL